MIFCENHLPTTEQPQSGESIQLQTELNFFPLQEEISYLHKQLFNLTLSHANLKENYEILKKQYDNMQQVIIDANLSLRDQVVIESLTMKYENAKKELQESRRLVNELRQIGWEYLPQKLKEEYKSGMESIETMRNQLNQAIHSEALAKSIASETLKKVSLLEGIIAGQTLTIDDLNKQIADMKTVHSNRIIEMRNAWEQTSIRLYLRAKRRQLHIEKQLNEVRSWFKKPTDELLEKIIFQSNLAFHYPSLQNCSKFLVVESECPVNNSKEAELQEPSIKAETEEFNKSSSPQHIETAVGALTKSSTDHMIITSLLMNNSQKWNISSEISSKHSKKIYNFKDNPYRLFQVDEDETKEKEEEDIGEDEEGKSLMESIFINKNSKDVHEDDAIHDVSENKNHSTLEEIHYKYQQEIQAKVKEIKAYKYLLKQMNHELEMLKSNKKTLNADQTLYIDKEKLTAENELLKINYHNEMLLRKKYHNLVENLKGNIRIYCRIRPVDLPTAEKDTASVTTIQHVKNESKVFALDQYTVLAKYNHTDRNYTFNRVFDQTSTEDEIFEEIKPLVQSSVDGYNVCIIGYGETGSGKTTTLFGGKDNAGLLPHIGDYLFELVNKPTFTEKYKSSISLMLLQLYNDRLIDVFNKNGESTQEDLEITINDNGIVDVPKATRLSVNDASGFHQIMEQIIPNNKTFSKSKILHSSKSHLILSIFLNITNKINQESYYGKFSIIDLAGSEQPARRGLTAEQLKEVNFISSTLSTLGDVVSALLTSQTYFPYQNSKLTQLMQDSLGGNSKSAMIITINPSITSMSETINSLNYATRVKLIQNKPQRTSSISRGIKATRSSINLQPPSTPTGSIKRKITNR
ncbi:unnamed protein product [Trichobilharzia szidati]|nr:unnamed protein product [Trichobilharzia szidati]